MSPTASNKKLLTIRIDEAMFYKMMELLISPTVVAKAALKAEIRRVEDRRVLQARKKRLQAVQRVDPRITEGALRSSSARVRRMKKIASVYEPSISG